MKWVSLSSQQSCQMQPGKKYLVMLLVKTKDECTDRCFVATFTDRHDQYLWFKDCFGIEFTINIIDYTYNDKICIKYILLDDIKMKASISDGVKQDKTREKEYIGSVDCIERDDKRNRMICSISVKEKKQFVINQNSQYKDYLVNKLVSGEDVKLTIYNCRSDSVLLPVLSTIDLDYK